MVKSTKDHKVLGRFTGGLTDAQARRKLGQPAMMQADLETVEDGLREYIINAAYNELDAQEEATAAKRLAKEERKNARTDPLTGLPNRLALNEKMAETITKVKTRKKSSAISVAFIDANDFGLINKTLGDDAGDKALETMGTYFRQNLRRQTDFMARKGGDEFIIVMNCSKKDAVKYLQKLKDGFLDEVTPAFLESCKDLEGDALDKKVDKYQKALAKKHKNPNLKREDLELSISCGVEELSPDMFKDLDTENKKDLKKAITTVMAASDDAQREAKEAHREARRLAGRPIVADRPL